MQLLSERQPEAAGQRAVPAQQGPARSLGTQLGAEAMGKRCCGGSPRASPPLPLAVRKTGCVDKAGAVPAVRGSSWKRLRRAGRGSFSLLPMLGKCIEWTFLPQIKKLSVQVRGRLPRYCINVFPEPTPPHRTSAARAENIPNEPGTPGPRRAEQELAMPWAAGKLWKSQTFCIPGQ